MANNSLTKDPQRTSVNPPGHENSGHSQGGDRMPTYISRGRYSAESIKKLVANPQDRAESVKKLVEAAGAKLLHFYITLGQYDFLVISEAPSAKEASAAVLAAASTGAVTDIETTEAFTTAEAKQLFAIAGKAAGKYKQPGK
jgi:uncharacterized protein with GYD domain